MAIPDPSLIISTIEFARKENYNSNAANDFRLAVKINGQSYPIPLFDWELIPIIRYADSEYKATVSSFGTTEDGKMDDENHLVAYHPSFVNTLVGLRLVQMDSIFSSVRLQKPTHFC